MPKKVIGFVIGFAACLASPGHAGVYNLGEPMLGPTASKGQIQALPYAQFKGLLTDQVNAGLPIETTIRKRYQDKRNELEGKLRAGKASVEDQVNLSAYLIYLGEQARAVEILTPLIARERDNYPASANLMTAQQLVGELERAASLIPQLKGRRPDIAGANPEQIEWYARVDSFHHRLIQERYREGLRSRGGRPTPPESVDSLFDVRFVGPSGRYEAGQLAPEQKAKLPPDAIAIVQQLLLWMPNDTRLYWLLGELYNAQGDIHTAAAIFDDCRRESTRRLDAAELREHRQIVHEAVANAPPPAPVTDGLADSFAANSNNSASSWIPGGWQLATVGSVAGVLIAVLVYFQIREWWRRN